MIYLTRKNKEKEQFLLNHHSIEKIEGNKDTIILLNNGKKYLVNETKDEIIDKIIEFEAKILQVSQYLKES